MKYDNDPFLATCSHDLSSADNFCKQLDPDQNRHKINPDDLDHQTVWHFNNIVPERFFIKVNF